jgi:uncharacterized protein
MTDMVRVVYRKYDGTLHWNLTLRRLGEDEHGVWLGAPVHTPLRKGHVAVEPFPWAYVYLIPRDPAAWWSASFNAEPKSTEIYVDVTTPARWSSAAEVCLVDLDLDVVRKRGADRALLVDEDEFAEHRVRYGYPPEVVEAAQSAAERLLSAVTAGAPPFALSSYGHWLAEVA